MTITALCVVVSLSDNDRDGIYSYSDDSFFPIDNQLFGNQGRSYNYYFTLELHSMFTYQPGQTCAFTADDDLWLLAAQFRKMCRFFMSLFRVFFWTSSLRSKTKVSRVCCVMSFDEFGPSNRSWCRKVKMTP